ncbi:FAD:protein FMN transferase [Pseudonocardia sp. GCM10023141]|uniref:FAD:protein FMN transferase n=1 Tax=Pseudonocardia sp. GCM10023141 TaxID=3252653 RepID=UPI00361AF6A0
MTAPPLVRHVEHVMGLPISVALRGRHAGDGRGRAAWAATLAVLRDADRVFSTYRADSVLSRLGRGELDLDQCPPEFFEVLALGEAARRDSGGAFDVRRGGLLDPSGVVKGWAAQRAAAHLADLPDTDFCLSAGGDITCRTLDPTAAPWRIGIEDPHDPSRLAAVVPVHTGAVATSGTARRGAHIVDARTGRPPTAPAASVTVVGAALTSVDIDATAAFALGVDGGRWLAGRGHWAVFIVDAEGP